jgi:hypothetical protein
MANLKFSAAVRNAMLDQITSLASTSAVIKIYTGTQPAGGGTATTLLGTLNCSATLADSAAAGVLTLNSITSDSADATGTATWFRLQTSGGTFVMDGDISTTTAGTGDLQLDDTSIVLNGTIALSGPNTITSPNAA